MSKIVKKVFTEYMYPAAVVSHEFLDLMSSVSITTQIFDKNPIGTFAFLVATASLSWEWIPFALVGSFISLYAFDVFCRNTQEEDAREAKFKVRFIHFKNLINLIHFDSKLDGVSTD